LKKGRNHQDGIKINEALDGYFKALGIDEKVHETRILSKWEELMGEAVSRRTENKYIKDKILYLQISSAVMRDELQHDKQAIIEKVNAAAGCELINDIYLR
jgi:predicted nucleic acid-binding Zn ribbon protein